MGAENERGEAKEEAQISQLAVVAAGDAKAWAEDNLGRVRDALAVAKEAKRKAEVQIDCLEVEQMSLLLELWVEKDEVSSLQSQAGKDKEAMEEDYQKALEVIFAYGYECSMFKHNICESQLEVPEGMPDSSNPLPLEFFMNPKCPPVPVVTKVAAAKVDLIELAKDPKENVSIGDQSRFCSP